MIYLKVGSRGSEVRILQKRLLDLGYPVGIPDGIFGWGTHKQVTNFQRNKKIAVDGIVGPITNSHLEYDLEHLNNISTSPAQRAADDLSVEVAMVKAVSEVESRGGGFFSDGKLKILYERHWMYRNLCRHRERYLAHELSETQPDIVYRKAGGYIGGSQEWNRLDRARSYHENSALMSASYGKYQIMGFHWERLGYNSVSDFVSFMQASEDNHLIVFSQFIKSDKRLHKAMYYKDFRSFAYYYNGPAYARYNYHIKLQNAYERYS